MDGAEVALGVSAALEVWSSAERQDRMIAARSRAAEIHRRSSELLQRAEVVLTRTGHLQQMISQTMSANPTPRMRLEELRSEHERLVTRLRTMPIIEQAKGILMAQSRCREDEAFDMLRRASQRTNVPVREVAAQVVATATAPASRRSVNGTGPQG